MTDLLDTEEKQKGMKLLLERILWRCRLQDEILNVLSFWFRNPDMFNRNKTVTKAAIYSTISFLRSIPFLQPIFYSSPIEKTGGIMLVSEDENNNSVLVVTERGTLLKTKTDVDKYLEVNKL